MRISIFSVMFLLGTQTQAQVQDVNGDNIVGAEEALALVEQWKGPASESSNSHNHLGQAWEGDGNPLTILGSFPKRPFVIGPGKGAGPNLDRAPLMLSNDAPSGHGLIVNSVGHGIFSSGGLNDQNSFVPDVVMGGDNGVIAATEETFSSLAVISNRGIRLWLDRDDNSDSLFEVDSGPSPGRINLLALNEEGTLFVRDRVVKSQSLTRMDHPLDPENKNLEHATVGSPEMKNLYDGVAILDERGEAWVDLPSYFEALNTNYRYALTPIGAPAPNLHVGRKAKGNRFKISGGNPRQEISWMVTGIRQDPYAKANPVQVEQEKSEEPKGMSLHQEWHREGVRKSSGLARELGD